MSAIFGGTDSILVNSYNANLKSSSNFSERLARNQQTILRNESFLDKVQDPTAGAYFMEHLTAELLKNFDIKQETIAKQKSRESWLSAEQIEIPNSFTKPRRKVQ